MRYSNPLHNIRFSLQENLPGNGYLHKITEMGEVAGRGWEHRVWRSQKGYGATPALHFTIVHLPLVDMGKGVVLSDLCLVFGYEERNRIFRKWEWGGRYYNLLDGGGSPSRHIIQSRMWEGGRDETRLSAPGEQGQHCTGSWGRAYTRHFRYGNYAKAVAQMVGTATSYDNGESMLHINCRNCGERKKPSQINKCGVCHHSKVTGICNRCLELSPQQYACAVCGIVTCRKSYCVGAYLDANDSTNGIAGMIVCRYCVRERGCYACATSKTYPSLDDIGFGKSLTPVNPLYSHGWHNVCDQHIRTCDGCNTPIIPYSACGEQICTYSHVYSVSVQMPSPKRLCWDCMRERMIDHMVKDHSLSEDRAETCFYIEPPPWARRYSRAEQKAINKETGRVEAYISPTRVKRIMKQRDVERKQRKQREREARIEREEWWASQITGNSTAVTVTISQT